MLFRYDLAITTSGAGAFTGYLGAAINGRIHCFKYVPTSIATGATLTITTAAADYTYDLPDGFDAIEGALNSPTHTGPYQRVQMRHGSG